MPCATSTPPVPRGLRRATDPLGTRLADLSALDACLTAPSPAPFATVTLFQAVERRFRPRAEAGGVRLAIHLQKSLPPVLVADQDRLEQILFNALSNAMAVTPRGGTITVEAQVGAVLDAGTSTQRLALMLTVTDTGPPAPDAVVDAVRRPDADLICCPDYGGLGLLTIKKLSVLLGGRVAFSTRPNRLSIVVEVQYERRRSTAAVSSSGTQARAAVAATVTATAAPGGLLLVSGDSGTGVLVQAMAAHVHDMPVTVARDGFGARRLLGVPDRVELALAFALILLDASAHSMEESAIETIKKIRAAGLTIPIAVLTGVSSKSARIVAAGADVVLCKPFTQQQLLSVITTWGNVSLKSSTDRPGRGRTAVAAVTLAGAPYNHKKDDSGNRSPLMV